MKNTLYIAIISAVVTVLINHYEEATGKSIVSLIKDKLPKEGD